jgi:DNA modification methylase
MLKNRDHSMLPSGRVLSVEYSPIADLKTNPSATRKHTRRKIRRLAGWIKEIGFTKPLVVDNNNVIVAGNACFEAAKELGMSKVPTVRLDGLSEHQLRSYAIADNRLCEIAEWDEPMLALEFQHLLSIDCPEFDIATTGFEVPEVDLILARVQGEAEAEQPVPEPDCNTPAITQPGDLWLMRDHRVFCGNALEANSYNVLFGRQRAAAAFTDPPYNLKIHGFATGNGSITHREFVMGSGEFSDFEFGCFLNRFQTLLVRYSVTGSLHYLCMDWRHLDVLIAAGKQNYSELLAICVWIKDNGGMGSFYRSQHEFVLVFRHGKGPHRNNVQLGRFGRNRSNVWAYPGAQTLTKQGEEKLLSMHPTSKPISMVCDAILDCSARNEIVADTFLGSGTTLMAAERVGRICRGIEIDPHYVDLAVTRWQRQTGERAIHAISGRAFDEIAAESQEVAHEQEKPSF